VLKAEKMARLWIQEVGGKERATRRNEQDNRVVWRTFYYLCVPDSFLGAETSDKKKLGNQLNADHGQLLHFRLSIKANDPITVKF